MSWNNGLERKKFEERQAILAEQYRSVGMTDEQIQKMYDYDLSVFRSERIYYTHTQALEIGGDDNEATCDISNFLLEYHQAENFRDYSNRYWWIDELERFYYVALSLSEKELELITLYVFEGHTQEEMSEILNCPQTTIERLRILHDFYRPGDETAFEMNLSKKARLGHDFRDYICPDSIERTADHIKLGEKYARVLFLKDYASYIKDSMVSELTELNRNLMLSIDVIPIPTDEAVREVENRLLGVETNITNWQRKQNQNNNFSAVVPYDMELQRKESKEFLDDLTTRDQRMMFAVITMVITADTKEQLDLDTETVLSTARKHMCQMATLKYQQTDGLNTVLPYGLRKINTFRTLTTESLAVFMPFKVQEIMDKGGIFFGENAISHNLIMCNKANLLNQSAFLLGVPGSGKSFSAKELITFLMLNTDDDILICDPEGEYAPLVEAMGDLGSVIRVSAGGRDRLNAMYMVDGYGENNPIVVKSEFIMSLIEQIDKKGVGPQHKSIIDRCITNVYRNAAEAGTIPTLCTLRDMLLEQPEPEAKQIALSLELYTTGSLDIFGKQSNVDLDKRIVVFDIHGLGSQLKPTGLLVITDTMLNRVTLNWKKGKRTHVFIDEFHVVFENEFSAQFFNSAWRQFRKRNAYPTAITQNVEYLLDSVQASTMFSDLCNYTDADFCKEHPIINFDTLSGFGEYQVVAVFKFYTNHEDFRYNEYTQMNEEQFKEFMSQVHARQCYDTGIDAEYGDQLITLSTCEYTYNNGRFVVVAKKV